VVSVCLNEATYRDKVMGCWLGKNAGGTLGAPLEKMWGNPEPFDISFYTQEIPEGGSPNDDLDIQLVWLKALEERGIDLTSRDLAEYWLNHIHYNPDEYGFHKMNLRLGLLPPISGWYNNPFKHSMGCPIRSEIWACIAPAMPDLAVAYAWADAVCDHAGGESVYGEMFNAAVESAAFLIADRDRLLDIGLSVIPEDCRTARAIRTAREAHQAGMSWREARDRVMNAVFNLNAQYSPINLGFETVGWLYGEDFGDALCKAVNCGWDTDCTGATLGALLGIIHGASALPQRWIAPLGRKLAVTPAPGIDHFTPPTDIDELTDRTIAVGRQVIARNHPRVLLSELSQASQTEPVPIDYQAVAKVHARPQNVVVHTLSPVEVAISYPDPESPCISEFAPFEVEIALRNRGAAPVHGVLTLVLPEVFASEQAGPHAFDIDGHGEWRLGRVTIHAVEPGQIRTRNTAWLEITLKDRPALEAVPLVMIGARKWLVSRLVPGGTLESCPFAPDGMPSHGIPAGWRAMTWPGNELVVEPLFERQPGVLALQQFVYNPEARTIHISVPNDYRMALFVNGALCKKTSHPVPCHPALWGDCDPVRQWDDIHINTCDFDMPEGWNHVFIQLERGGEPIRAFLNLSYDPRLLHGCHDVEQTRFPWEVKENSPKSLKTAN
jgi:ADP-ribosylglycohydrolase